MCFKLCESLWDYLPYKEMCALYVKMYKVTTGLQLSRRSRCLYATRRASSEISALNGSTVQAKRNKKTRLTLTAHDWNKKDESFDY